MADWTTSPAITANVQVTGSEQPEVVYGWSEVATKGAGTRTLYPFDPSEPTALPLTVGGVMPFFDWPEWTRSTVATAYFGEAGGGCRQAEYRQTEAGQASPVNVAFAADELAEARPTNDSWHFAIEGKRGDVVTRRWSFENDFTWRVYDDPSSSPLQIIRPALPTDLPTSFVKPKGAGLLDVGHQDVDEVESYAQFVAQAVPQFHTERTRWFGPCAKPAE